jgi:hypothetical protein
MLCLDLVGHMKAGSTLQLVFVSLLLLGGITEAAGKGKAAGDRVYQWTDEDGVRHYGDRVPPEYATHERIVLNQHGVEVGRLAGQKTEEEKATEIRRAELLAEQRKVRDAAVLRDKVLLSTYLSIEEIEALRDRRIALVAGQIRVTQIYLDNLRNKLMKLEKEAKRYAPYSKTPNAKPIDGKLSRELSDTLDSIMLYEQNLARYHGEQNQLMAKFTADINRFRKLHSLN